MHFLETKVFPDQKALSPLSEAMVVFSCITTAETGERFVYWEDITSLHRVEIWGGRTAVSIELPPSKDIVSCWYICLPFLTLDPSQRPHVTHKSANSVSCYMHLGQENVPPGMKICLGACSSHMTGKQDGGCISLNIREVLA